LSLNRRKMIEETFGWLKTVGGFRKTRHRGLDKVSGQAVFCFAAWQWVARGDREKRLTLGQLSIAADGSQTLP